MRGQTVKNSQVVLNEILEIETVQLQKIRVQRDGSVRVEATFSKDEWALFEKTKSAVSHSIPSGEFAAVTAYCWKKELERKRPSSMKEGKLRYSQGVRRADAVATFNRDKTCRHHNPGGSFCCSDFQPQVDHIISRWRGGGNEPENLQLLCGFHNRLKYSREAEEMRKMH